jgi:hypothetical protein
MSRALATASLCAIALIAAIAPTPAGAEFGLHEVGVTFFKDKDGTLATQAGSHPFKTTVQIAVNTKIVEGNESKKLEVPDEEAKDIFTKLPPGLVANPTAVPPCSAADFSAGEESACPLTSVIGIFNLTFGFGEPHLLHVPVFNLTPPPGSAIRFGFRALGVPVVIDGGIEEHPPYRAFGNSHLVAQGGFFYRGGLDLWGNPVSPAHDEERGECGTSPGPDKCHVSIAEKPFFMLPRSCTGPLVSEIEADSWQHPGEFLSYSFSAEEMTGCSKLAFAPEIDSRLSTDQAESPTGLSFDLDVTDHGLESPDGVAASDIKKVVTILPEGVTANPSQAEGLATCSEADLRRESSSSKPGEGCPEASKIGTVEVETPLLEEKLLKGGLFIATPHKNPFGTLLALYMTIKSPELGINIVSEGRVEPDPKTGQLIAIFGEPGHELPQAPFSHFRLHFREGGRSPLISPSTCGTYTTRAIMTPWANPDSTYEATSSFEIKHGVGGGPCPHGEPFEPGFQAGSEQNSAGSYSPFSMHLTRRDGDQDLTRFDATLPPGVVAKLAGVQQCPDAQIAKAKENTGEQEIHNPSCSDAAKIGTVQGGAGVGSQLTYVPGSIYLAGPFHGAPLSVVGIVPAVAGPFDVGTVVVRQALQINPRTGEVTADGAHSDPIPHILAGIPLRVRDLQVNVNRPDFTIVPTSCDPFATKASIWGGGANPFSAADDAPVARQSGYQATNCARLGFKPSLSLKLKGGTSRGAHPALHSLYKPRSGDANLENLVLRLPRSAFLDQGHIRTICTRVQFAAHDCPAGAIYGHVKAFTPLLSEPLTGPIYLRSSNHNLPDLVLALHGLVDFEGVGRIDSKHGGIRVTFTEVPDAPISKVVVDMEGGKKGLIVNSTNLCANVHRADAQLLAHSGARANSKPVMGARCGRG